MSILSGIWSKGIFPVFLLQHFLPEQLQLSQQISSVHSRPTLNCEGYSIAQNQLIGEGGGGKVFKANYIRNFYSDSLSSEGVLKISQILSGQSIRNECNILRHLEGVNHIEKCLAMCEVENGVGDKRVAILLTPLFEPKMGAEGSLSALSSIRQEIESSVSNEVSNNIAWKATTNLVDACIAMLVAGVASSDLQFLTDPTSGDLLVIDMSEAVQLPILSSPTKITDPNVGTSIILHRVSGETTVLNERLSLALSEKDMQLVRSFISELRSFFPRQLEQTADEYLQKKLHDKLHDMQAYSFLFEE